jgi:hypothetical protein
VGWPAPALPLRQSAHSHNKSATPERKTLPEIAGTNDRWQFPYRQALCPRERRLARPRVARGTLGPHGSSLARIDGV